MCGVCEGVWDCVGVCGDVCGGRGNEEEGTIILAHGSGCLPQLYLEATVDEN